MILECLLEVMVKTWRLGEDTYVFSVNNGIERGKWETRLF
jgi:hypothetical protein